MASELGRDEVSRRRVGGEITEHGDPLVVARIGVTFSEYNFRAGLMELGTKHEFAGLTPRQSPRFTANRPTGDHLRKSRHINLRIPTANTKRVQLECLARKVLIDSHAPPALTPFEQLSGLRVRPDRHLIVEVEQHRGMPLDSEQHVREPAEHIRADGFSFEASRKSEHEILIDRYREVVRPEVRESLDKRAIGADALTKSCAGLGYIDRSVHLPDLHERGDGVRLLGG